GALLNSTLTMRSFLTRHGYAAWSIQRPSWKPQRSVSLSARRSRTARFPMTACRDSGGPGDDERCDACDALITKQELVLEGRASPLRLPTRSPFSSTLSGSPLGSREARAEVVAPTPRVEVSQSFHA